MKTLIMASILLVILAGVAQAAQPKFSGPVGYNIVVTEEEVVGTNVRKLAKFTTRFEGTLTVDPNSLDPSGNFPDITMQGTVSDGSSVTIFCSWENMGGATAEGDNSNKTVNDKLLLLAGCSFKALSDSETVGIAFLNLSGIQMRPKGWTNNYPQSMKITGSKIYGATNASVFNGTFSSTLTPQ